MIARNEKGKFLPGGPPGPGRPKRMDFAELLRQTLTNADAQEIYRRAISQAKLGDAKARTWIFSFLMSPAPRTLKVEQEEATEGRKTIDAIIEHMPDEHLAAFELALAKARQS